MRRLLVLMMLVGTISAVPAATAHADIGSTIVERFWDSAVTLVKNRLESSTPPLVNLLQEAEKVFLGHTEDVTVMGPIQDAYKAMRVAGLLLLGLCTVISLAGVTEESLLGRSSDITEWVRRFCIAAFMTMGGIHFYGLWIRVFNVLIDGFRNYLDTHWTGPNDPTALITQLVPMMNHENILLLGLFVLITVLVLLVLWFLIGGVRMAEMALAVIIAPLVWPLYLLPSLEDIPKAAFRMFLGINALLLIIVAMLRLAVRMVPGGGLANTVWNFVPAISLLLMTIFLPTMIKRLIGQGNSGVSALTTAAYALAGLKGMTLMASGGGGAPAAAPPAISNVPKSPAEPSAYPLATIPNSRSSGSTTGPGSPGGGQPVYYWSTAPRQIHQGYTAARQGLEAPWNPSTAQGTTIEMGQTAPGSDEWVPLSVQAFEEGRERYFRLQQDQKEDDKE